MPKAQKTERIPHFYLYATALLTLTVVSAVGLVTNIMAIGDLGPTWIHTVAAVTRFAVIFALLLPLLFKKHL